MGDTGWIYPGTVAEDETVGDTSWNDEANAKADDGSGAYSDALGSGGSTVSDYSVILVTNDDPDGSESDDKASGDISGSYETKTYGGSSDTWGYSLSESDVENSNFGCMIAYWVDGMGTTYFLKATNFGFDIPDEATIDGIEVEVEAKNPDNYADVDYIKMKVHYTNGNGGGSSKTQAIIL